MREILFRGKVARDCVGVSTQRKYKKGTWVFGDLSHTNYDPPLIDQNNDDPVPVDPSTVGQYTGRTDKNGKRVFEGDIIRLYNGAVGVVLWSDNDQAYLIFQDPVKMVILDDFGNYGRPEYYEVIGNIYDNPELLEGGTDNGV
ncbi:MAG: hypothetical protein IKB79_04880 [Oscillospiraceae bacterium]|nr:hypothetical protein [Oscillospiraceae bacterium]